ncbi:hypothetical protein WG954_20920 [Lacibacter sp. H375]|uniref:hypothetical protein n=1 Tax=Lacibacter sp. H375 TaxID=3133424 RepID=UPI0030BEE027
MTKLYLDWNVITTLRQPENLLSQDDIHTFNTLGAIINSSSENLIIPYSNAHLNDLLKSYKKGERKRVAESLQFISILTKDVCLTQYWNDENAKWHQRNPEEYFQDLIDNGEDVDMTSLDTILEPLKEYGLGAIFDTFKQLPHDINFDEIEKYNPNFLLFFKKAKLENSIYAVMEDFIGLTNEMKTNPTVYNELRNLFKTAIPLDSSIHNVDNVIEMLDNTLPKTMLNKSFTQLYLENDKTETSKNKDYSKIIGTFMQLDFVGYGSDKLTEKNQYDNLFNDSLHCFYAAHCDYFVTSDKKIYKKAKAVFQNEKINTRVMKPKEFIDFVQSDI